MRCLVLLLAGIALHGADRPASDRPADATPDQFAGPVFIEQDGVVVVEAEHLAYNPSTWRLCADIGQPTSDKPEFINDPDPMWPSGRGYLRYVGAGNGGRDVDGGQTLQGRKEDWLVVKVWCTTPGTYLVDLRNFHHELDGDNDIWISHLGKTDGIPRGADRCARGYTWLDWNNARPVELVAGLNGVVLAGRSSGFGVDRIAIFRPRRAETARSPDTPESARRPDPAEQARLTRQLESLPPATDAGHRRAAAALWMASRAPVLEADLRTRIEAACAGIAAESAPARQAVLAAIAAGDRREVQAALAAVRDWRGTALAAWFDQAGVLAKATRAVADFEAVVAAGKPVDPARVQALRESLQAGSDAAADPELRQRYRDLLRRTRPPARP